MAQSRSNVVLYIRTVSTHGFTTPSPPPAPAASCVACGKPFEGFHRGWGGTHCTACVDWAAKAFPFAWEIARLKKRWRAFERRWPEGAVKGVEEWLHLKGKVESFVRKVNE